jgi:hypothetical protein
VLEGIANGIERLISKQHIGGMCLLVWGYSTKPTVPVLPPQVMRISMGSRSTNIKLERVVLLESRRFPDMLEQSHQTVLGI